MSYIPRVAGDIIGVDTTHLTFDATHQLLSLPGVETYAYDASGRRVMKAPAAGGVAAATFSFYNHAGQLMYAYNASSGQSTNYIYLNGKLIARHAGSTITYLLTDRLGSPVREANTSGTVTASFSYRPFGGLFSGPAQNQPGFTGQVYDPETSFVYMQARYYAVGLGRFLSPDPVGPATGNTFNFSRYAYASNNPVINTDPDGRDSVGENIDENAQASADAGDKAATFGWSFAGVLWKALGAEPVSQVADKGRQAETSDKIMAVVTIVTLGKGEEAATFAKDVTQGVEDVAKGAPEVSKAFSSEKQALVEMAKSDKKTGMTSGDMQAYKDLNKELPDPFLTKQIHGPETHKFGAPTSRQPHGHVGPVKHIPIRDPPQQ